MRLFKMNILLIGSGGREHAIAWKLSQSRRVRRLFCIPGSDAISELAECNNINPLDGNAVADFCFSSKIDMVVVGPEAPLAAGLADALGAAGMAVFGPLAASARLESSKLFAKEFMARHGIATAGFSILKNPSQAETALKAVKFPAVLKADGLASGKGVRICRDIQQARAAVSDFMEKRIFGASGATVLLEEHLEGREASLMAFCDGKTCLLMPPSRDHKRLLDGNNGPNTGGMGAYAPVPDIDADMLARIKREIFERFISGLEHDALDYCGVIYAGLMLTAHGPKVIEFNCRFGDPETQAVLPLIKTDLADIIEACVARRLGEVRLEVYPGAAVSVVLAAKGYPDNPQKGAVITGLKESASSGAFVFHSGTQKTASGWTTGGGRVLSVAAQAGNFEDARSGAYAAASKINFEGMQYREDIGAL